VEAIRELGLKIRVTDIFEELLNRLVLLPVGLLLNDLVFVKADDLDKDSDFERRLEARNVLVGAK
jgi:hypothetical protein